MMKRFDRILCSLATLVLLLTYVSPSLAQVINPKYQDLYIEETPSNDFDLVETMISELKTGVTSGTKKVIEWGAKKLLYQIFPDLKGESEVEKLATMMSAMNNQLDNLTKALNTASETLNCKSLADIINNINTSVCRKSPGEALAGFLDVDSEDDLKEARLDTVLQSLGINELQYNQTGLSVDNYTDLVMKLLTNEYKVAMDGQIYTMDIMDVISCLMTYQYKWENQAYEEWTEMEDYLLNYASCLLFISQLSVRARKQKCDDSGLHYYKQFDNRMLTLLKYVDELEAMYQKRYVKLDDQYRHYWWQGSDIMFYTKALKGSIPQENPKAGMDMNHIDDCYGIYHTFWAEFNTQIRESFWEDFVTYKRKGVSTRLVTYDELNTIYCDYGGKQTLWEIFFSKAEGNFSNPGIAEKNHGKAEWILDTEAYPLKYIFHLTKGDDLVCYYVKDPGLKKKLGSFKLETATQKLCIYHYRKTEPQKTDLAIQIGVYSADEGEPMVYTEIVDVPKTGDSTPVALYVMMMVAAFGIITVMICRRKRA